MLFCLMKYKDARMCGTNSYKVCFFQKHIIEHGADKEKERGIPRVSRLGNRELKLQPKWKCVI